MSKILESALELIGKTPLLKLNKYSAKAGIKDAVIYGKLESYKGSHAMNNIVLKKLFSDPQNYDIVEVK